MNIEKLLTPRWKVIADFPFSPFKINDIVFDGVFGQLRISTSGYFKIADYPAIFKKLEWWEEREEKDLPKYVKSENNVVKVVEYIELFNEFIYVRFKFKGVNEIFGKSIHCLMPATKEEYDNSK